MKKSRHPTYVKIISLIFLSSVFFLAPGKSEAQTSATFPLSYSPDKRYFVDAAGKPFLIQGDSPWSILVQISEADVDYYLADRRQKGFNTLVMNLIENFYMTYKNPPRWQAADGRLIPIFNTAGDFSTPNEEYFSHVDRVLTKAAENDMIVLLNPVYMGYKGSSWDTRTDGWWVELEANGPTKCRNYGRWLGDRYKNYNNIIWVAGGDRIPPSAEDGTKNFYEILLGIKEKAPNQMWTAHWDNMMDSLDLNPLFNGLPTPSQFVDDMDVNGVYSYPKAIPYNDTSCNPSWLRTTAIHERVLRAYNKNYSMPIYLWESRYEGSWACNTPEVIRRIAYEADFSGASG